jgi:hypothetical protein
VFEHERSKLALPLRPLTRLGQDQESTGASSEGARPKRIGEKKNGDKQIAPVSLTASRCGTPSAPRMGNQPSRSRLCERGWFVGGNALASERIIGQCDHALRYECTCRGLCRGNRPWARLRLISLFATSGNTPSRHRCARLLGRRRGSCEHLGGGGRLSPSITCTAKPSASPRPQGLENLRASARDAPRCM